MLWFNFTLGRQSGLSFANGEIFLGKMIIIPAFVVQTPRESLNDKKKINLRKILFSFGCPVP